MTLETRILEVVAQGPMFASEMIARVVKELATSVASSIPKLDADIRHTMWRLIGEEKIELTYDRELKIPEEAR